jgi:hypothetical protein
VINGIRPGWNLERVEKFSEYKESKLKQDSSITMAYAFRFVRHKLKRVPLFDKKITAEEEKQDSFAEKYRADAAEGRVRRKKAEIEMQKLGSC